MKVKRFALVSILAGLAGSFVAAMAAAAQQGARQPNIIYIAADDLGWADVGFHGSDIKTPNIDELAQTGARLEQFYGQPTCTPTPAPVMPGRYPLPYGVETLGFPASMSYGSPTPDG